MHPASRVTFLTQGNCFLPARSNEPLFLILSKLMQLQQRMHLATDVGVCTVRLEAYRRQSLVTFRSSQPVMQEQLATLDCLVEMSGWNPGAGHALTKAIIMVAHAVRNSLQGVPNQFTAGELLKVNLLACCCCLASIRGVTDCISSCKTRKPFVHWHHNGSLQDSGSLIRGCIMQLNDACFSFWPALHFPAIS